MKERYLFHTEVLKGKLIRKIIVEIAFFLILGSFLFTAGRGKNFYLNKFSHFNNKLKTFKANFIQKKYINIIEDFDEPQEGKIFLKKSGKNLFLKRVVEKPGKIFMIVRDGKVVVYYPKRGQAIKKNFSKSKSRYLTLGIGSDLKSLEKHFVIDFSGEKRLGKHTCGILMLTPKGEKLKSYFKKIFLWVDSKTGMVLRQKVIEENGDYILLDFKDIKVNLRLKNSIFKLKIPSGVDIIS